MSLETFSPSVCIILLLHIVNLERLAKGPSFTIYPETHGVRCDRYFLLYSDLNVRALNTAQRVPSRIMGSGYALWLLLDRIHPAS